MGLDRASDRGPSSRGEFVEPVLRGFCDWAESIGELGLWIDLVLLGGTKLHVHRLRTQVTAVGAGELPCLPLPGNPLDGPFGVVVGQADAVGLDESDEKFPEPENVVHGLGHGVCQDSFRRSAVILSSRSASSGTGGSSLCSRPDGHHMICDQEVQRTQRHSALPPGRPPSTSRNRRLPARNGCAGSSAAGTGLTSLEKLGPCQVGVGPAAWHGAGGWLIFSQSRQVNISRTVWITFQRCGTASSVSVISSPIFDNFRQ